jgi:hypothetical protein
MKWARPVARMGKIQHLYIYIYFFKYQTKRPVETRRNKSECNIKMNFRKIMYEVADFIKLAREIWLNYGYF